MQMRKRRAAEITHDQQYQQPQHSSGSKRDGLDAAEEEGVEKQEDDVDDNDEIRQLSSTMEFRSATVSREFIFSILLVFLLDLWLQSVSQDSRVLRMYLPLYGDMETKTKGISVQYRQQQMHIKCISDSAINRQRLSRRILCFDSLSGDLASGRPSICPQHTEELMTLSGLQSKYVDTYYYCGSHSEKDKIFIRRVLDQLFCKSLRHIVMFHFLVSLEKTLIECKKNFR